MSIIHKEYRIGDASQRYQVRLLNDTNLTNISPSDIKQIQRDPSDTPLQALILIRK